MSLNLIYSPRSILKSAKILVLIGVMLITGKVSAQIPGSDSSYRPPIYAGKVGQFKAFPKASADIIFLGNSIMTYTDWNELLGLKTAKNRGIPGDMTFGVLDRLDDVVAGKPAKIFILIGINDITRNIPDSLILRNYKRIIARIKKGSPLTKIYLHTLFPVNDTYKPLIGKTANILNVNAGIKKIVAEEKIMLVDVYPRLVDSTGKMDPKNTFDGIHLSELGYFIWADVLKKGGYLK